jgi:molecular chaperone DnaJ
MVSASASKGAERRVATRDRPATFRVKGRGVSGQGRRSSGDLLVTVEVTVPKKLNAEQRAAVEAMRGLFDENPRADLAVK